MIYWFSCKFMAQENQTLAWRIISPSQDVWAYETSLTPSRFIKAHQPSQERTQSCVCVRVLWISILPLFLRFVYWVLERFRQCAIFVFHIIISVQPRRCRSTGYIIYLFLFLFIFNLCFPHGELGLFFFIYILIESILPLSLNCEQKKRNVASFYWKYVYWHFLFIGKLLHRFSCNHAGYLFSRITAAQ